MEHTRIVIMRFDHPRRHLYSRLYGLLVLEKLLVRFWRIVSPPLTSHSVRVHLLPIQLGKSRPCVDADVWGHQLLDYRTVFDNDVVTVLSSSQLSDLERVLQADDVGLSVELGDLLTVVLGNNEEIRTMPAINASTPVRVGDTVLLGADASSTELKGMLGYRTPLRIQDSGRVIYSVPAARIQEMVLEGVQLGIPASSFAKDLGDSDDVLMAASRLYHPTSGSPYRWFQVAMGDARRLGVKIQ